MNENLNTMSESLKRLHQSNSTAAGEAVPAKKAKPSTADVMSVIVWNYSRTRPIQREKLTKQTKARMVYLKK